MSNAALATNIVNLDEYRRNRGEKKPMSLPAQTAVAQSPGAPRIWVYWVPAWVW